MKDSCTDHRDLIGGIIGVPNHEVVGDIDEGSPHHTVDDATCISALSWGGSQEPIDQRQPPKRTSTSQGAITTRRLHPFPWSASNDDGEAVPNNPPTRVKQMDAKATNDGDRTLRRSTLVANDSSLGGKFSTLPKYACIKYNCVVIILTIFCSLYLPSLFQHHGSQHAD